MIKNPLKAKDPEMTLLLGVAVASATSLLHCCSINY